MTVESDRLDREFCNVLRRKASRMRDHHDTRLPLGDNELLTHRGQRPARLSPEGFSVLRACADRGGCIYVADLVRMAPGRLAVARASLSRTLRRLWRAGWVRHIPSADDRVGPNAGLAIVDEC